MFVANASSLFKMEKHISLITTITIIFYPLSFTCIADLCNDFHPILLIFSLPFPFKRSFPLFWSRSKKLNQYNVTRFHFINYAMLSVCWQYL